MASKFHIEIFSRLVLRVEDVEQIFIWGRRLSDMHESSVLRSSHGLWGDFATALARCIEALPTDKQTTLLHRIAMLPFEAPQNSPEHRRSDWIRPFELIAWYRPDRLIAVSNPDLLLEVERIIHTAEIGEETPATWKKIFWFRSLNILSDLDAGRVSQALWREKPEWPIKPGFLPQAAFKFPSPQAQLDLDTSFRNWLLTRNLARFSATSTMIVQRSSGARGWGVPANNSFLEVWKVSLRRSSWSGDDFLKGIRAVEEWWIEEGMAATEDASHLSQVDDLIATRLELIDEVLSMGIDQLSDFDGCFKDKRIPVAIEKLAQALERSGRKLWRVDLHATIMSRDVDGLEFIQKQLAQVFLGDIDTHMQRAAAVTRWLIARPTEFITSNLTFLFDSLAGISTARRMPGSVWSLGLLASASKLLTPKQIDMAELAMNLFFDDLQYSRRSEGSGIADDAVPLLRFRCMELCFLMHRSIGKDSLALRRWLETAGTDPLPELRYSRFIPE